MTEPPIVSIIMPVFNGELHLTQALDSIVKQTWEQWELIAIDDGSTDGTAAILSSFEKKDQRIKILSIEHGGVIQALQAGQTQIRGDFVTRMDADDLMPKDKLANLIQPILKNASTPQISVGKVKYFSDEQQGLGDGYRRYERWLNGNLMANDPYEEIFRECVIPSPNWMMNTATFQAIGGFDDLSYPEDYHFCFRCRLNGIKISPVDTITHLWRDWPDRSTRTADHYKDNLFFNLKARFYAQDKPYPENTTLVWGAGNKGKALVRALLDQGVNFEWTCENPRKIDHHIYGVQIKEPSLETMSGVNVLIAVSNPTEQRELVEKIAKRSPSENVRPILFC